MEIMSHDILSYALTKDKYEECVEWNHPKYMFLQKRKEMSVIQANTETTIDAEMLVTGNVDGEDPLVNTSH